MKIKYFNLPILILFLTFNNLLSEEKIPPFKKDSPPKKEDDKNTGKPKKWAYVYSNSFEKFSENYIKRIQTQYDVICVTGLMLRGTGQLRFQKELINKLDKAKIKYRDEEEPEDTKEGTDKKDNQKEDKKEVAENKD
ncbi:MAG: hypothetical protein KDK36_08490, partial [Leptospiraceae bacterium]|nr:hypothetical protein [Leptospiraceae bacterium]